MAVVSRGFRGRGRGGVDLPPGQYLTEDFPVLSAGPTPRVSRDTWEFTIITETGRRHTWTWADMMALPSESVTVDLHCVTKWSKLHTGWRGVAIDTLIENTLVENTLVETPRVKNTLVENTLVENDSLVENAGSAAGYALVHAYGGYTTNLPRADLVGGQAWIAYEYDGVPLPPEHGGPARLLVPHLYLWKSAKWVRAIEFGHNDHPGFWETAGYHNYGDPWREQRYWGD